MVDTTTTTLALVKQTVGANRNTWGAILNTNFDSVDTAIAGRLAISTTGGSGTITQAQAKANFIDVTGALASDATIVVPNNSKQWTIKNGTTNDFAVLIKTSGGTATSVPAGTTKIIFCDGADGVARLDYNEVGQFAFFGTTAVPNGWFECEGSTKSRAGRGIDLFAKTSTTWGNGNGVTTFTIPDAYTAGKFLRSRTAAVAVGTAQSDQNKAHAHAGTTAATTLSGNIVSSPVSNDHAHTYSFSTSGHSADHSHVVTYTEVFVRAFDGGSAAVALGPGGNINTLGVSANHSHTGSGTTSGIDANHSHTVNIASGSASTIVTMASDGGTEVRVTNLSAILCIKY